MLSKSRCIFPRRRLQISYVCQTLRNLSEERHFKLAIFNQNGTLNCIDAVYGQWCENRSKTLSRFLKTDVSADFFRVVGYDPIKKKIIQGGISEQPHQLVKQNLIELLEKKHNSNFLNVRSLVTDVWGQDIGLNETEKRVKPIGRIVEVFEKLKDSAIKIAVCTTESRSNTVKIVESLGVSHMIDATLCGDDNAVFPKPHPSNVYAICAATGVRPVNTAMIGDTQTDMMLGHRAKTGANIGVLSGVGSRQVLGPLANKIVNNIEQVPGILLEVNSLKPQFSIRRNYR